MQMFTEKNGENIVQTRLLLSKEKTYVYLYVLIYFFPLDKSTRLWNICAQTRTRLYLGSRAAHSLWSQKTRQTTVREEGAV